jgi:xanthine dehydrogenase accessory factor
MSAIILLRGGGDLASGVALRLYHSGLQLIITELPEPLVVRRLVSFAEAVYAGETRVEGVLARRAVDLNQALAILKAGHIPVLIDPQAAALDSLGRLLHPAAPLIVVDGRMTKRPPDISLEAADFLVGLGPGFVAGVNCHAVIETNRGHNMGRVIWQGEPEADTGVPESVERHQADRVLRAPEDGQLQSFVEIGERLVAGQMIAQVGEGLVRAPFSGVLRGLVHPGLFVRSGVKIGDVDPRDDPSFSRLVSDKALAVGGGVLEAILSRPELRSHLWPPSPEG